MSNDDTQTERRGSARRTTPQAGRFLPAGAFDPNDPSTYVIGSDGWAYPRPEITSAEAAVADVEQLFSLSEQQQIADFRESYAGRVMPTRPRRLRISGSQRAADTIEMQRQQTNRLRQELANGTVLTTQYDTLSDLSAQYYESLDTWTFWNYINDMEDKTRALIKASEDFDPVEMLDRYNMLADLNVPEFDFDETYTWVELMAMPLRFSEEQTAFLNAKFETLGLYDRYRVNRPQYVTDNQDLSFQSVYKQLIAESIGRNTTAQTLMDGFAEEQINEVEKLLADFDDRTIALQLDSLARRLRGKPLTAQEFEAIKSSIAMFDEDVTEEELSAGIKQQLEVLQKPFDVAMGTEVGVTFQRDAEAALRNYFQDDERTRWFQIQRNTQQGMDFDAIASGRGLFAPLEDVPAIIEQQESTQL